MCIFGMNNLYASLVAVHLLDGCILAWWLYTDLVVVHLLGGCTPTWWLYTDLVAVHHLVKR